MGAFLSIARGSVEPPCLLELRLNMADDNGTKEEKPIALVGKGRKMQLNLHNVMSPCSSHRQIK